VPGSRSKYEFS